jgi:hypothetical protein
MTLSSFRVSPHEGHLSRVKRMVAYLLKMKHGFIRVCTGEPDFSDLPPKDHDCSHTVHGKVKEAIPRDAPPPLGKCMVHTTMTM